MACNCGGFGISKVPETVVCPNCNEECYIKSILIRCDKCGGTFRLKDAIKTLLNKSQG